MTNVKMIQRMNYKETAHNTHIAKDCNKVSRIKETKSVALVVKAF